MGLVTLMCACNGGAIRSGGLEEVPNSFSVVQTGADALIVNLHHKALWNVTFLANLLNDKFSAEVHLHAADEIDAYPVEE